MTDAAPFTLTALLERLDFIRVDDGEDEGFLWICVHDAHAMRVAKLRPDYTNRYIIDLERGCGVGDSIQEAATEAVRDTHDLLLRALDDYSTDHPRNLAALNHHIARLSLLRALIAFDGEDTP